MTRQQILFRCLVLLELGKLGEYRTLEEIIIDTMQSLGFTNHGRKIVSNIQVRKIFPMLMEWNRTLRDMKYKRCVLKSMYWRCDTKKEYAEEIPKQLEKFKYESTKDEEDFI